MFLPRSLTEKFFTVDQLTGTQDPCQTKKHFHPTNRVTTRHIYITTSHRRPDVPGAKDRGGGVVRGVPNKNVEDARRKI